MCFQVVCTWGPCCETASLHFDLNRFLDFSGHLRFCYNHKWQYQEFFMAFMKIAKWEPRLRLWIVFRKISSEWHVTGVPLSLLLSSFHAISYSNITPWWQGIGTFITVSPRNDCVGESVEKLEEESLLWERAEILRQICDPGTPKCSSI